MICEVYDNQFDKLYLHQFYQEVITRLPYNFTNIANRNTAPYGYSGSHQLVGCNIFSRTEINNVTSIELQWFEQFYEMFKILEDKILREKFYLSDISVNMQTKEMDGTCHSDAEDDDEYTILVMTNPEWEKEWGPASFQLLEKYDNNARVIEEHEYVPGRVILIPSPHPHRGIAPIEKYIYRTSVVFRVTPNFGKHIP